MYGLTNMVKHKQIKRRPQQTNWLGGSLSLNPRHRTLVKRNDVFKHNSKYVMSTMFKDSDRDGVMNAFDCKPHNRNQQGLIDNFIKIFKKKKTDEEPVKTITVEEAQRRARQIAIINKAKKGMAREKRDVARARSKKITTRVNSFGQRAMLAIARANPKYSMEMERRYVGLQPMGKTARKKLNLDYERMRLARVARRQLLGGGAIKANTLTKTISTIFPMVQARTSSGGAVGVPGQRGRPRGSFKSKYAAYGGVFQYRKAMALRKKAAKFAEQQAELQQKIQPQYETQQYQPEQMQQEQMPQEEQVPQETPGAVPDYQQFQEAMANGEQLPEVVYEQAPQPQPQYQQPPQQYAPEPQKRPIRPVFKSSGGSPYGSKTAVVEGSLAPSNANDDYIEYADAFTGERKWKKKVKPEGWSRPQGPNQEPIVKQSWMGNR